jgi:hypothetical protein
MIEPGHGRFASSAPARKNSRLATKTSRHFPFSAFSIQPLAFPSVSPKNPQIRSQKSAKSPAKTPIVNPRQP